MAPHAPPPGSVSRQGRPSGRRSTGRSSVDRGAPRRACGPQGLLIGGCAHVASQGEGAPTGALPPPAGGLSGSSSLAESLWKGVLPRFGISEGVQLMWRTPPTDPCHLGGGLSPNRDSWSPFFRFSLLMGFFESPVFPIKGLLKPLLPKRPVAWMVFRGVFFQAHGFS